MKILGKVFKYACSAFMAFWAVVFIIGAIGTMRTDPVFVTISLLLVLAGFFTYRAAKSKGLEGSAFTWWLCGMFVPVVSWIDVHKATSRVISAAGKNFASGRLSVN